MLQRMSLCEVSYFVAMLSIVMLGGRYADCRDVISATVYSKKTVKPRRYFVAVQS